MKISTTVVSPGYPRSGQGIGMFVNRQRPTVVGEFRTGWSAFAVVPHREIARTGDAARALFLPSGVKRHQVPLCFRRASYLT